MAKKGLFFETYEKLASEGATADQKAINEWTRAREIDLEELVHVADTQVERMGPPGIALMVEPAVLIMMGIHIGYEAAMTAVRREQERDLGL
jgi:hypothetical protein